MKAVIVAGAIFALSSHGAGAQTTQDINKGIAQILAKDPEHGGKIVKWAEACTSPCVLPAEFVNGGEQLQYHAAAIILARDSKELQVKGVSACVSACTILVDLAASMQVKTCVGWEIAWGVHKAYVKVNGKAVEGHEQYRYKAKPIESWLAQEGGMKADFRYRYVPSEIVEATYGLCPGTAL